MTRFQNILAVVIVMVVLALLAAIFHQLFYVRGTALMGQAVATMTAPPTVALTATPRLKATDAHSSAPATWTVTPTPSPWPTWTPTFTPSPTPMDTSTPLPPHRPTAVPVWITPTPHPSMTVPITIPAAVPRQPIPAEAITVVLLGSDKRPDWDYWNTDAIQYLVIYPEQHSVTMLSIPRDLYVFLPNYWMTRINTADRYGELFDYDGGGLGLLNQTMLYNLGITADYYVRVNFDGLIALVDTLGGIDVPVHCHLEDFWPYPNEAGEYPRMVLEPGMHHFDGEQALWYSRTRKTTSVFSREKRQQQVLEAMWRKAKDTNLLAAAPELYAQTQGLYETDMGWGNIAQMVALAMQMSSSDVRIYNIGPRQVIPYTTYQGGNVFLLNWYTTEPVIADVWAKPSESRAAQAAIRVEVWNGTPNADWDWLVADRLAHAGFTPVIGGADRRDYAQTQIILFGDTTKGTGLDLVQWVTGVDDANVLLQSGDASEFKMRVIVGQDYVTCP